MNRRSFILIALLLVLAAGYGWLVQRSAPVPIAALAVQPPGGTTSFAFDRDLVLAEVRVDAGATNTESDAPVWHLVTDPSADEGPEPLRTFPYGRSIRGLASAGGPAALEPGQTYRLSGRADAGVFALEFVAR